MLKYFASYYDTFRIERKCGYLSESKMDCDIDATKYNEHLEGMRLIYFLIVLIDDFESSKAFLGHQSPLPILETTVSRLLSDET